MFFRYLLSLWQREFTFGPILGVYLFLVALLLSILILAYLFFARSHRQILKKDAQKKRREILKLQHLFEESKRVIVEKELHIKIMEEKLDRISTDITDLARRNDPSFLIRFQELYPEATRRILHKHGDLSRSELLLCAMIFLNFTTKEIATYTFVERRTVETKKYRLKKKMGLPGNLSLDKYILTFL